MKKYLFTIFLMLLVLTGQAATVVIQYTNWSGTVATNAAVQITPQSSPMQDGNWITIGAPIRTNLTDGVVTNYMRKGVYKLQPVATAVNPFIISVPDDANTYFASQLDVRGIIFYPGGVVDRLAAGDNITFTTNTSTLTISSTGGGGSNAIVRAGQTLNAITNATSDFTVLAIAMTNGVGRNTTNMNRFNIESNIVSLTAVARGTNVTDLQVLRSAADQVATSAGSSILGGSGNKNTNSAYSVIAGGEGNTTSQAEYSFGGGGQGNIFGGGGTATYGIIVGGVSNLNSSVGGIIVGGGFNKLLADVAFIGGGNSNMIDASGAIVFGQSNTIGGSAQYGFIGSGETNYVDGAYSAIGTGQRNTIDLDASYSFIGSGNGNYIGLDAGSSFIGAGASNRIEAAGGIIPGGSSNSVTAAGATALGHRLTNATANSVRLGYFTNYSEALSSGQFNVGGNLRGTSEQGGQIPDAYIFGLDLRGGFMRLDGHTANSMILNAGSEGHPVVITGPNTNTIYYFGYDGDTDTARFWSSNDIVTIADFHGDGAGLSNAVDIIAGSGVTITTNANKRSFTLAATGGGGSATNAISNVSTNGSIMLTSVTNLNLTNFPVLATSEGSTVTIDGSPSPWNMDINGALRRLTNVANIQTTNLNVYNGATQNPTNVFTVSTPATSNTFGINTNGEVWVNTRLNWAGGSGQLLETGHLQSETAGNSGINNFLAGSSDNALYGSGNAIVGGSGNLTTNATTSSGIYAGAANRIGNTTPGSISSSVILGGSYNFIDTNTAYAIGNGAILAGQSNYISVDNAKIIGTMVSNTTFDSAVMLGFFTNRMLVHSNGTATIVGAITNLALGGATPRIVQADANGRLYAVMETNAVENGSAGSATFWTNTTTLFVSPTSTSNGIKGVIEAPYAISNAWREAVVGDTIVLLPGTYVITNSLTNKVNMKVVGIGMPKLRWQNGGPGVTNGQPESCIIPADNNYIGFLSITNEGYTHGSTIGMSHLRGHTACTNVVVDTVEHLGTPTTITVLGTGSDGSWFRHTNRCQVRFVNNKYAQPWDNHVQAHSAEHEFTFDNCQFDILGPYMYFAGVTVMERAAGIVAMSGTAYVNNCYFNVRGSTNGNWPIYLPSDAGTVTGAVVYVRDSVLISTNEIVKNGVVGSYVTFINSQTNGVSVTMSNAVFTANIRNEGILTNLGAIKVGPADDPFSIMLNTDGSINFGVGTGTLGASGGATFQDHVLAPTLTVQTWLLNEGAQTNTALAGTGFRYVQVDEVGGFRAVNSTNITFTDSVITLVVDGGGSAITTGAKGSVRVPRDMSVTGWDIVADQSGSAVVDVWYDTYANFPPTVADTIAGSEKPTLSSAIKNQDTSLSTWTDTTLTKGDYIKWNVDSASTVTHITVTIYGKAL